MTLVPDRVLPGLAGGAGVPPRLALPHRPQPQHGLHAAVAQVGHGDTDSLRLVVVNHAVVVIPDTDSNLVIG